MSDNHLPTDTTLEKQLTVLGFVTADQVKDFSYVITGLVYLKRVACGQFQYVWLCHYEGRFLEGVFESYLVEKQTRAPKGKRKKSEYEKVGHVPLCSLTFRYFDELTPLLNVTYEPTNPKTEGPPY